MPGQHHHSGDSLPENEDEKEHDGGDHQKQVEEPLAAIAGARLDPRGEEVPARVLVAVAQGREVHGHEEPDSCYDASFRLTCDLDNLVLRVHVLRLAEGEQTPVMVPALPGEEPPGRQPGLIQVLVGVVHKVCKEDGLVCASLEISQVTHLNGGEELLHERVSLGRLQLHVLVVVVLPQGLPEEAGKVRWVEAAGPVVVLLLLLLPLPGRRRLALQGLLAGPRPAGRPRAGTLQQCTGRGSSPGRRRGGADRPRPRHAPRRAGGAGAVDAHKLLQLQRGDPMPVAPPAPLGPCQPAMRRDNELARVLVVLVGAVRSLQQRGFVLLSTRCTCALENGAVLDQHVLDPVLLVPQALKVLHDVVHAILGLAPDLVVVFRKAIDAQLLEIVLCELLDVAEISRRLACISNRVVANGDMVLKEAAAAELVHARDPFFDQLFVVLAGGLVEDAPRSPLVVVVALVVGQRPVLHGVPEARGMDLAQLEGVELAEPCVPDVLVCSLLLLAEERDGVQHLRYVVCLQLLLDAGRDLALHETLGGLAGIRKELVHYLLPQGRGQVAVRDRD
mmetsp:Transcript_85631/g.242805  ORF Transcript_85631/g.242805 Transcript_85631/m.242805 type:complete len:561 (+) Transcript_85631:956-2638(+)